MGDHEDFFATLGGLDDVISGDGGASKVKIGDTNDLDDIFSAITNFGEGGPPQADAAPAPAPSMLPPSTSPVNVETAPAAVPTPVVVAEEEEGEEEEERAEDLDLEGVEDEGEEGGGEAKAEVKVEESKPVEKAVVVVEEKEEVKSVITAPAPPTAEVVAAPAPSPAPATPPPPAAPSVPDETKELYGAFLEHRVFPAREKAYRVLLSPLPQLPTLPTLSPEGVSGGGEEGEEVQQASALSGVVPNLPAQRAQQLLLGAATTIPQYDAGCAGDLLATLLPLLGAHGGGEGGHPTQGSAPSEIDPMEECVRALQLLGPLSALIKSNIHAPTFSRYLHALCLYHEPELTTALDKVCGGWEGVSTPPSSSTTTTTTTTGGAPPTSVTAGGGCVPPWWVDSLFSGALRGSLLPPTAMHPLWDRVLLFLHASNDKGWMGGNDSRLTFALAAIGATLVSREAIALRAICRTAAAATQGPASSAGARHMVCGTLQKALKKAVWEGKASSSSSSSSSSSYSSSSTPPSAVFHPYAESITALLAAASTLASATPQSSLLKTTPLPPPLHSSHPHHKNSILHMAAWEVLPQAVYGWGRVAGAGEACAAGKGSTGGGAGGSTVAPAPFDARGYFQSSPSSWLLPQPCSPLKPLHQLILDVRPLSHRRCGRLSAAFHVDPRTLVLSPTPTTAVAAAAAAAAAGGGEEKGGLTLLEEASQWEERSWGPPQPTSAESMGDQGDGAISVSSSTSTASAAAGASAGDATSAEGVSLSEAIQALKPSSGTLHIVVVGVGVPLLAHAYSSLPACPLQACKDLDDARVQALVMALAVEGGVKYISVLRGGFAALMAAAGASSSGSGSGSGGGDVMGGGGVGTFGTQSAWGSANFFLPCVPPSCLWSDPPCPPSTSLNLLAPLHLNVGEWDTARFTLGALEGTWREAAEEGGEGFPTTSTTTNTSSSAATISPLLPSSMLDFDPSTSPYTREDREVGGLGGRELIGARVEAALRQFKERAGPALAAFKSGAARLWDDFSNNNSAGVVGGGEGGGEGGALPPSSSILSEKRMEQLSAAKEKAKVAASVAATMFKAALAPPPPTKPSTTGGGGGGGGGSGAPAPPSLSLPKLPSWSYLQSAAMAAKTAAVSAASAGAKQLQASAAAAMASEPGTLGSLLAATSSGGGGGGGGGVRGKGGVGVVARERSGSDGVGALLAHQLAGLGEGGELGLFDVKWKGALSVFAGVVGGGGEGSSSSDAAAAAAAAATAPTPPSPTYLALSKDRLIVLKPHPSGRLGVGIVVDNYHLSELGKASFSKKSPGKVTVYLRRTGEAGTAPGTAATAAPAAATSAGDAPGGGEGGDAPAPSSPTPPPKSDATTLVARVFTLDGGAEAVKEFITQLQKNVSEAMN